MPQDQKSIVQVVQELWDMLVSYAKQETIAPLKGLQRFVGFGVGGSVLTGIGGILLTLSALRFMQTQTDGRFGGNWSWVPYVVAMLVLGAVIYLTVRAITKEPKR